VAARALSPADLAPLAALWAVVFATAPAVFAPVEQDLARRLAVPAATPSRSSALLRRSAQTTGITLVCVVGLTGLLSLYLHRRLFDGEALLMAGLLLALVGYAVLHLVRGVLLGVGRLGSYGGLLAAEGTARLLPAAVLLWVGTTGPGPYGLALGAAPLAAALLGLPALRLARSGHVPGARRSWSPALLATASVVSLGMINIGPVLAKALAGPAEQAAASLILVGLVLTRLPLFAVPTLQALLLPRFARLSAAGGASAVGRLVARLVLWYAAAWTAGLLLVAALGPTALRLFFGPEYVLDRPDLLLLAVGSAGHLLAILLGLALIAQGRAAALAAAWCTGLAVGGTVVAVVPDLMLRIELGLLAGAWTTFAMVAWALLPRRERDRSHQEVARCS
jgi:O-antigen/teichoic acid export membrane protein